MCPLKNKPSRNTSKSEVLSEYLAPPSFFEMPEGLKHEFNLFGVLKYELPHCGMGRKTLYRVLLFPHKEASVKFAALFLLTSMFLSQSVLARTDSIPEVLKNTLAMTVSTALLQPKEDLTTEGNLVLFPQRLDTPLVEHGAKVRFKYQIQKNKRAPLVFLIPGTGGQYSSTTSLYIAEKLFALGYHIVTVDNPFHWRFAVSASASGLPGNPAVDSSDLYRVLLEVRKYLKAQTGIRPSSYSLAGYSLGGLQSLFLKRIDDKAAQFNFDRILAINPPMDFLHAVKQLDLLAYRARNIGENQKAYITGRIVNVGGKLINSKNTSGAAPSFEEIFKKFKLSNSDLNYLVADSFSSSLRDVVYASQQVHDLGILKIPASRYRQNARLTEASKITFFDYMTEVVFPRVQIRRGSNFDINELNSEISLYQFEDLIRSNPNIYLVHAQDDFLLKEGDVSWLQNVFGSRSLIFPFGGHCGDIGFPQFTQYLNSVFSR